MSRHIFNFVYRSLLRNASFSLISLFGLAISLAASIVIFMHYFSELSFDKHIPESERSYRLITRYREGDYWSRTFAGFGDALANCPEVEKLTTFNDIKNTQVQIGDSEYNIPESVIADTAFMDFFGLELVSGRREDLGEPNTVFVTEELAGRLFPGENPLGKEIFIKQFEGFRDDSIGHFTIAGLVKPLPENTHFGFEMICSWQGPFSNRLEGMKRAKLFGVHIYVRLFEGVPAAKVEAGLTALSLPFYEGTPGPPIDVFNSKLQPVRDIHFTPDINRETRPIIRKSLIYILISIGFLILILMTVNYTSALIVLSQQQARATGIMRNLGASKQDLFRLSLFRNALIVGLSLILSWIIIGLAEPFLQSVLGDRWSFRSLSLQMLLAGAAIGIPVTVLATLGMRLPLRRNFSVFGILTVIQIAIVIILLGFSLVIERQISYLDRKDLGFTGENVIVVRIPAESPRGSFLVEEMEKQAGVLSASTAHMHPADISQSMEFSQAGKNYPFSFRVVAPESLETLEIELLEKFGAPEGPLRDWIINETFYKQLLQDFSAGDIASGEFSARDLDPDDARSQFRIGGVMKDFHYSSLHNRIENFAFVMSDPGRSYHRWLLVRFAEGQSESVLGEIKRMMDTHFHEKALDYFFLEDYLNDQYADSGELSAIVRLFTLLAILIALTGLYGLALFITRRRSKEIGLRKLHGAGTRRIILMLNLGFLKWIGLAFVLACPLTFLALQKWLVNFAYKTALPWWIFILPGIIVACVTMLAVSWQTGAAARSNPVHTIRMNH